MMAVSKTVAFLAFVLVLSFLDEAFCMRITKRDVIEGEKDESSELDSTKTGGNSVSDDESELPKGEPIGHEGDDKSKDGDDGDGNPGKEDENPSDDGEKRPSDGGGEDSSDNGGEKIPSDGGDEEPSDDGEKRTSDEGDEESSDNGGEEEPSDDGEKGPTDGGENEPSDEKVSDGGERRRSTDGGDIGKPWDRKEDGSETTPKNEEDYAKNNGGDDIPKDNSSSEDDNGARSSPEDDDLEPSITNEGESSDTNSSFNPSEWEDKNSTDNDIEPVSDSDFSFRGGFRFDSPFFNFEQVEQYFIKLEDAMENIFQRAMLEVGNSTDSFKNSTDKVIVVNGQKYNVHTTVIKGGNENRSISIEAISAFPINNTRKRRSLW